MPESLKPYPMAPALDTGTCFQGSEQSPIPDADRMTGYAKTKPLSELQDRRQLK
jgi:hypothetical protein